MKAYGTWQAEFGQFHVALDQFVADNVIWRGAEAD